MVRLTQVTAPGFAHRTLAHPPVERLDETGRHTPTNTTIHLVRMLPVAQLTLLPVSSPVVMPPEAGPHKPAYKVLQLMALPEYLEHLKRH